MPELIIRNNSVERIERFQSLQGGQYWRASKAIPHEGIPEGEILLISSVRWVDDKAHTVILRAHPRHHGKSVGIPLESGTGTKWKTMGEHRFLLNDFLNNFIYEPDAKKDRECELAKIQGQVAQLQGNMTKVLNTPELMKDVVNQELNRQAEEKAKREGTANMLPAVIPQNTQSLVNGTIGSALSAGVTELQVASLKTAAAQMAEIATIQTKWITTRTGEITEVIKSMAPFYEEMAAAQLASSEDMQTHVKKLMEGIETLDLYTGKDVIVNCIQQGQSAPESEPLTFVQKKLLVDEELAVWLDVEEWFDFQNIDMFFNALKTKPGLINQIFPSERCVVVFATTRRYIDYKDRWDNMQNNAANQNVFFIVRDGENLNQVYSPVESHLGADRLFPSHDDQTRHFRGVDGDQIKYEDVRYSDRLSSHERMALHYKRLLILCCGLDHREQLFGNFYDRSDAFKFVSMEFQEKYFRFIHDDDGTGLLDNPELKKRPSLENYISFANSHLRSGSRVICHWSALVNPDTAPGAVKETPKEQYSSYHLTCSPIKDVETVIAYTSNDDIVVDMAAEKYSYSSGIHRVINARVALSKFSDSWNADAHVLPYLCVDAVRAEDLEWYIHNRGFRANHLYYIRLFKNTLNYIKQERLQEESARKTLLDAMQSGNIALPEEREAIIDQTIMAWRSGNRGAPLSTALDGGANWTSLLNQMYMLAGGAMERQPDVEAFAKEHGYTPLRMIIASNGKIVIYLAPKPEERDDRAESHKWAHRVSLDFRKKGVKETGRSWALVSKSSASETTVYEWPEVCEWAGLKSVFGTYNAKQKAMEFIAEGAVQLHRINSANQDDIVELIGQWCSAYNKINLKGRTGGTVQSPVLCIPVGISVGHFSYEYIYCGTFRPERLLHRLSYSPEATELLVDTYCSFFAKPEGKAERIQNSEDSELYLFSSEIKPDCDGIFSTHLSFEYNSIFEQSDYYDFATHISGMNSMWKMASYLNSRNNHSKQKIMYLPDTLTDISGQPALDEACNNEIHHIEVDLVHVEIPRNMEGNAPIVEEDEKPLRAREWFDIGPVGFDDSDATKGIIVNGHTLKRTSFKNSDEAVLYIVKYDRRARIRNTYNDKISPAKGTIRFYRNHY